MSLLFPTPRASVARRLARSGAACLIAVCSALVLAPGDAQAQWKWRDASGRIQLSDLPPPASVPEKDILQRPGSGRQAAPVPTPSAGSVGSASPMGSTSSAASAPTAGQPAPSATRARTAPESELDKKRKADEQEKAGMAKAEEERRNAQRADNCSRARNLVATMDSGQRLTRINEKGEREFLDDRQRASEAQRARDIMASDCR